MKEIIRKIAMGGGKTLVSLFSAAVAVAASATFGATLYVTPTGAGTQDGSDWDNAFAGIQAAGLQHSGESEVTARGGVPGVQPLPAAGRLTFCRQH